MYQGIDFYNLSQSLAGAIFGAMIQQMERPSDPPPPLLQLRRGRAEAPAWFLVQALEFDPEPITVANLRVRDIYASERIVAALLELMASEKWLEPVAGGGFVLAPAGRAIQDDLKARRTAALAKTDIPLETAEITQLESLLNRIIVASMACDDPPGNWCLAHSRNRAPAADAPILDKILHYTSDFNAFRDDAHMAAFRPLAISAYGWEGFTFVRAGQGNTAVDIDKQLHYRGYSAAEYDEALQGLVQRGWLTETDGVYAITETGTQVWETAEQQTNDYFYGPWKGLTNEEVAELGRLMETLQDRLSNG